MLRFPSFLARAPEGGAVDHHAQHAALPFVESRSGVEVCLITSKETGRWVLPKGWPKPGHAPHELARAEAYEEAGLQGRISRNPLGTYDYAKRLHVFVSVLCTVDVYPLRVERQMLEWPEQPWRRLKWVTPQEAASLVEEEDLAALIAGFSGA
jgi:8-oxo-dGTP pyrophosphatase MutT (NUDIX family)